MMQKIKNNFGVIISILLHLLLLLSAVRIFDRDRYDMKEYQRTQTKGYTVQLVQQPNQPVAPPPQSQVVPNTNPGGSPDKILNTKEQINFKDNSEELAKEAAAKAAAEKAKQAAKLARQKERQEEHAIKEAEIKKERAIEKSYSNQGEKIARVQKEVIVAASAPIVDYTKEGSGDKIDASTDGNGTKTGAFDLRRVEYGRAAAYAIRQNIVAPPGYEGTVLPYRAFVTLDQNMQFVKMQVVQSTGDPQFDTNIAKALRETIYPPLPPGADWHYYHNIDFTIH